MLVLLGHDPLVDGLGRGLALGPDPAGVLAPPIPSPALLLILVINLALRILQPDTAIRLIQNSRLIVVCLRKYFNYILGWS